MSENEVTEIKRNKQNEILSLNSAEFLQLVTDFFEEIAPNSTCPICSNPSGLVSRGAGNSRSGLNGFDEETGETNILFLYRIVCTRCGFTMLHEYGPLASWWQEREGRKNEI